MGNATASPTPIERTPNIGANLAAELRLVGIDSLEALMRVGFWDAWLQLRRANPERNSVPACLALAGAVAGVRWNHLRIWALNGLCVSDMERVSDMGLASHLGGCAG